MITFKLCNFICSEAFPGQAPATPPPTATPTTLSGRHRMDGISEWSVFNLLTHLFISSQPVLIKHATPEPTNWQQFIFCRACVQNFSWQQMFQTITSLIYLERRGLADKRRRAFLVLSLLVRRCIFLPCPCWILQDLDLWDRVTLGVFIQTLRLFGPLPQQQVVSIIVTDRTRSFYIP